MKATRQSIKTIQNYLKKLAASPAIPPLKLGRNRLDFSPQRLDKSMHLVQQMCTEELLPYSIIEKRIDQSSIFYIMGLALYNALTQEKFDGVLQHPAIKEPFIYQFLHLALIQEAKHIETYLQKFEAFEADQKESFALHGDNSVEIFSSIGFNAFKNDDSYYAKKMNESTSLLIIADGMGGTQEGKLASSKALALCSALLLQNFSGDPNPKAIQELLQNTILSVNQSIIEFGKEQQIELGTTLTAVIIINNTYYIGHIGDSRVYKLTAARALQLTQDHSMRELMHTGNDSKNTLLYAIGRAFDASHIFTTHGELEAGSELLLCSDGFWESLDESHFDEDMETLINTLFDTLPQDNVTFIRFSPKRKPKRPITIKWHVMISSLIIAIITILGSIYSNLFTTYPMELKIHPPYVNVLIDNEPYDKNRQYRIERHALLIQAPGYQPQKVEIHTHQKSQEIRLTSSLPNFDYLNHLYPLSTNSFFMMNRANYQVEQYPYLRDEQWYMINVLNDRIFGLVVSVDIVLVDGE